MSGVRGSRLLVSVAQEVRAGQGAGVVTPMGHTGLVTPRQLPGTAYYYWSPQQVTNGLEYQWKISLYEYLFLYP